MPNRGAKKAGRKKPPYKAILSTDWNECLAPCGPFDCMAFIYPALASEFTAVFRAYTDNRISLGEAAGRIQKLLPAPISAEQMDAYLEQAFATYPGVSNLIDWCRRHSVLFMINTTGMVGYFQRACAKELLPPIPVLSAHPMVNFAACDSDPDRILELSEIGDKGKHTAAIVRTFGISAEKVFIMGDSGGDGPHFKWGSDNRAFLIGSMTKPSLRKYCLDHHIHIDLQIGPSYRGQQKRNPDREMRTDFMDLAPTLEAFLNK